MKLPKWFCDLEECTGVTATLLAAFALFCVAAHLLVTGIPANNLWLTALGLVTAWATWCLGRTAARLIARMVEGYPEAASAVEAKPAAAKQRLLPLRRQAGDATGET